MIPAEAVPGTRVQHIYYGLWTVDSTVFFIGEGGILRCN